MSCHLHGIYEPCTCPAYLIAMGQNDAVVEADLAQEEGEAAREPCPNCAWLRQMREKGSKAA